METKYVPCTDQFIHTKESTQDWRVKFQAIEGPKWRDRPAEWECHPRWDNAFRIPGTVSPLPQVAGTGGRPGRRSSADSLLSEIVGSWAYLSES